MGEALGKKEGTPLLLPFFTKYISQFRVDFELFFVS